MTKTWSQIAAEFQLQLASIYDKDEIHQLFLMCYEYIFNKKAFHYHIDSHLQLTNEELRQMEDILTQLTTNKPIQHIFGQAHFYGKIFNVSENTLIPRPETEELVDLIINDHKEKSGLAIIDIGTGTGCIPISLAYHLSANFTAIEISPKAMKIAKQNANQHQKDINFIQADILEWELIFPGEWKFDIVVSNPPYITPFERKEMHTNVLQYEPHLALFVEEDAPLLFYDYIADFALSHLNNKGYLYVEINQYLSYETASLLQKKGFVNIDIIKDINGADRMIRCQLF